MSPSLLPEVLSAPSRVLYGSPMGWSPRPPVSSGAPGLPQWVSPSVPLPSVPRGELLAPPLLELSAPSKETLLRSSLALPVQSGDFRLHLC